MSTKKLKLDSLGGQLNFSKFAGKVVVLPLPNVSGR